MHSVAARAGEQYNLVSSLQRRRRRESINNVRISDGKVASVMGWWRKTNGV